ncbi:piggyBac transposable element-derived protein 2-like [Anastrepha ludens]|uniref:piggyBac transposable element-derived protein 2-like n=1 Tax=Anastrepha ludens TaxID=28586 RepID=UPI0023AFAE17|nr:piggyBac transposable element-derived protein 2-like [Anastrepha ludens]
MSDEEFNDFMDFCENSDKEIEGDDFNSDNDVNDPDFVVPNQNDSFLQETANNISVSDLSLSLAVPTGPQENLKSMSVPVSQGEIEITGTDEFSGRGIPTSSAHFECDVANLRNNMKEFQNLLWRKNNLQINVEELTFHNPNLEEFFHLKTPYDCFAYFFNTELLELICDETNLYARQKKINSTFVCTVIRLIFMSLYRFPNVRSYWGRHSFQPIKNAMPVNRFEEIRSYIHFADGSKRPSRDHADYDILYLVRPIIKHMNVRFSSVPMSQRLSVDEQMCGTKMSKTNIKQYMPKKPHKWGFKIVSICDTKGFSYSFELFTGAADNVREEGMPDLGAASNIVVRLSRNIPDFSNHIVYFDNYFTSLGLLVYLRSRGIYSLGTFRANRVKNCKLCSDEQLVVKKAFRGYSEEFVATAFGVDISTVAWKVRKPVRLASTYAGVQPFKSNNPSDRNTLSRRYNRNRKQYEYVSCSNIVKEYNRHMGGVDLMDSLIGRYKIRMKTGKWPSRIFHHVIDLAIVNAYVLYREEIAETLLLISETKKLGRPTTAEKQAEEVPKGSKLLYLPPPNIRYDCLNHWPNFCDKSSKRQCRNKPCKSETQVYCEKCNIPLCMSVKKSCFKEFHAE